MEVEENETFQQQALEITPPGTDFDPTKQPQNGEEFLMHMMYERKQCPVVVVKRPDKLEQQPKSSAVNIDEQLNCTDVLPDPNLVPTKEWKSVQSINFIRTRSRILMLRQHMLQHNYDNSLEPPLITDESAWLKFCQQHRPLLSTILRLNQRTLEQLLVMLSDWLKAEESDEATNEGINIAATASSSTSTGGSTVTILDLACSDQWLGDWLYAILACLHLPLEPSVHGTLRDIARSCMHLRSLLKSHEYEKAIPYNLFIYLIGKIFHQLDLLEYV